MDKYLIVMESKEKSDELVQDYLNNGKLAIRCKYLDEIKNKELLDEMNKQLIRESDYVVVYGDCKCLDYAINCNKNIIININGNSKLFKAKSNKYIEKRDWEEFQKTGLVLYINQILHAFGYAITYEREEEDGNKIIEVYPARVKFRGFGGESIDNAYTNLAEYMKNNAEDLYKDVIE